MGKLSGLTKNQIKDEITKWAPRFGIDHALKRELKTYSKGMLQRIGFMATIIHHPKIVILDEPLSGLDPIGRKELKDVIIEVHKEGKTVFFSSHIVPDVEEICDRVIFLKEGKLVYNGTVGSLINDSTSIDYIVTAKVSDNLNLSTVLKEQINLPDNLKRFVVEPLKKDELLMNLIKAGSNIVSVEMKRPSLEEIFYLSRGKQ